MIVLQFAILFFIIQNFFIFEPLGLQQIKTAF